MRIVNLKNVKEVKINNKKMLIIVTYVDNTWFKKRYDLKEGFFLDVERIKDSTKNVEGFVIL